METIYDNGTKRVHTFTNPKVSTLIEQGLDERDAMSLIAQGGTFQENSFEPTLTGLIILLVVLLLLVILLFALGGPGDGFWVGFAIADILDFD